MNYFTFIPSISVGLKVFLGLTLAIFLYCPKSEAAQTAIVVADQAVIYSTSELTGPIGYVPRGKKVQVGEVARNRNQAYPIIVSGKIAYIRARDISFETDENQNFVATRFYELARERYNTHYSLGFINYSSQYKSEITGLDEAFNWYGYQIKGEFIHDSRWGVHILTTGMWGTKGEEQFRTIELGFGGSFMVFELSRLRINLFAQFLGIPFANYTVGSKFRVNGGGYGGGLGLSATYNLQSRWGVEGSIGVYQTRLMGFDAPEEYESPDPTFSGARTVLSAYYRF
ncbi:MAG: hypothetical protein WDA09_08815 [Bacteriovoracaceae bacterium]